MLENTLVKPVRSHHARHEQSVEQYSSLHKEGIHRAEFRITNLSRGTKELVEEAVITREKHARSGETLTLTEAIDHDVIHVRFHTLVSVQELIEGLKRKNVEIAEFSIVWNDDVTAATEQTEQNMAA